MDFDYSTVRSLIHTEFCCPKNGMPLCRSVVEEFEHQRRVVECLDVAHLTETRAEYRGRKPECLFFWSYIRVICSARNLIPFL